MKSKVFRSKVDAWLLALPFGSLVMMAIPFYAAGLMWMLVAVFAFFVALTALLMVTMKYEILGDELIIPGTFLGKRHIKIADIQRLEATNTLISSPALSLDRMWIVRKTTKGDWRDGNGSAWRSFVNDLQQHDIAISPERKDEFVKALLAVNPDIEVRL